jgi:hypothetical protein
VRYINLQLQVIVNLYTFLSENISLVSAVDTQLEATTRSIFKLKQIRSRVDLKGKKDFREL